MKPPRKLTIRHRRAPGSPAAKPSVAAAPTPKRQWRVKIVGLVTRPQASGRVAVPHGEYVMKETELGGYLLAREGGPKFALTAPETSTYVSEKAIKIVEGMWP